MYHLIKSHTYHKISHNSIDLWYQKLGHLNFKNPTKIVNTGGVRGIPTLSKKEPSVCGPCQLGKQLKESYSSLQQIITTRVLELLHMDLMRPM